MEMHSSGVCGQARLAGVVGGELDHGADDDEK
jgi:hypothetical protein